MSWVKGPCPTCSQSTRPGLLWLGGDDWLECPTCDPKHPGQMQFHEEVFKPTERTIFIPGMGAISAPIRHEYDQKGMDLCQSTP